jgi:hypothetical protein
MSAYEFLQVHTHELEPDPTPNEAINEDPPVEEAEPEPSDTLLIKAAKGSCPNPLPPSDICRILSKNSKLSANLAHIEYKVSYHQAYSGQSLSLIDRGANGGVPGTVIHIIFKTGRTVVIRAIDKPSVHKY